MLSSRRRTWPSNFAFSGAAMPLQRRVRHHLRPQRSTRHIAYERINASTSLPDEPLDVLEIFLDLRPIAMLSSPAAMSYRPP